MQNNAPNSVLRERISDTSILKVTQKPNRPIIQTSRRRWFVLPVFTMVTFLTAFHWMIIAIVPDITSKYYMVSETIIIWSTTTYMVVYCFTVWLAFWLMNAKGLRYLVIMASGASMVGAAFKFLSTFGRQFWLYELGQICCAFAEAFAICLPARIAAVWFPSNEVSTATSIGVFGNQFGIAMSFVIPTYIMTGPIETESHDSNLTIESTEYWYDNEDSEAFLEVKSQMVKMMAITLIACTAVFIMACIIFEDAPKYAPSRARQRSVSKAASAQQNQTTKEILKSYLRLISSKNFILLCVGYGLLVGSYYSLSGNINKLVTPNLGDDISQKDKSKHAGKMGLIMIVAGSVASLAAGCILDAAKKYKLISVVCYLLTFMMYIVWTFVLRMENLLLDYVIVGVLGFFMTGYLPIGFEFASEISWPESETTSSGFLNLAAMLVGAILTPIAEICISKKGPFTANLVICAALFLGLILTLFINEKSRRQQADNESSTTLESEEKNNRTEELPVRSIISVELADPWLG